MGWFRMTILRVERRLAPWVERGNVAHREAMASAHETAMIQDQRSVVARIVFELGLHDRNNHIVDMIQQVVKGAKSK